LETNCGPLSEIIVFGTPCRLSILSRYILASFTVEYFVFTGKKCANLVNQSIMTQIESKFLDVVGKLVIKSMPISSHFQDGMGNGCNIPAG
jgi:trehalose utilization protein